MLLIGHINSKSRKQISHDQAFDSNRGRFFSSSNLRVLSHFFHHSKSPISFLFSPAAILSPKFLAKMALKTLKTTSNKNATVTPYQERVYALLQQIPSGKITSYAAMSRALNSSPRAVGGALRVNPFAPEIPCHRCIASTGVSLIKEEGKKVGKRFANGYDA